MNVFIVVRIYDARDGCLHCNNARLMMIDNSFFLVASFEIMDAVRIWEVIR